jgi:adenylosuccinate synthase
MGELRAFAVVDLGFGDAGKGLLTDFLTRRTGAGVIVRFNGGAQAGHNVVTSDGRHHTFAQIGAGSFVPGVRTFLARDVVVHPTSLVEEARVLGDKGVVDPLERVAISENALLVTPFHQAANRLRELARGSSRHGSCGVGVGETVSDALRDPFDAVIASDLGDEKVLAEKLGSARRRLRETVGGLRVPASDAARLERLIFESAAVIPAWIERCRPILGCVAPDEQLARWLASTDAVIFEGAQGLLLDETHGFHPWTTWSNCTVDNVRNLLRESAPKTELRVIGVLRAHAVRHGPGPLPTEDAALDDLVREHNATNAWQGKVRRGWFDGVLARYALALTPRLDALAISHVDALERRAHWPICARYEVDDPVDADLCKGTTGGIADLIPRVRTSLERQERFGRLLMRSFPRLTKVNATNYLDRIEEVLQRRIDIVSQGPTAADIRMRTPALGLELSGSRDSGSGISGSPAVSAPS